MVKRIGWLWAWAPLMALTVFTVVAGLLWLCDVGAETTGPAALALFGATVAKALDMHRQHLDEQSREDERLSRGLDEVRRLLFMIELSPGAQPSMVASVVNAWAHHHSLKIPGGSEDAFMDRLVAYGNAPDDPGRQWLAGLRNVVTEERDKIKKPPGTEAAGLEAATGTSDSITR